MAEITISSDMFSGERKQSLVVIEGFHHKSFQAMAGAALIKPFWAMGILVTSDTFQV